MKKQGKRRNICQKRLSERLDITKYVAGKYKDYEVYKEALNAATNEVRKCKRSFECKLAQNI